MTEKRFTLTFDDKIVDNLTGIIHDVHSGYDVAMDLSGLLNVLNNENEQLKARIQYLERKIERERNIHVKEHEKWEEEIQKENEQLKQQLQEEQCRTTPITLTTHISDDDFKKIELMLKKYFGDFE